MTFAVISILLTILGASLTFFSKMLSDQQTRNKTLAPDEVRTDKSGLRVLVVFTIIVLIYGVFLVVRFWDRIQQQMDSLAFGGGLFLMMVFGMFVQVIISNHRAGRPLSTVTGSQLIFPLLLSPIVFYAIWSVAATTPEVSFAVYCAFLNGYFWESTVSKANPPDAPQSP